MTILKQPGKVVTAVTLFVGIYAISPYISFSDDVIIFMFLLLPFLTFWMAYVILRFGRKPLRELEPDEEWGYEDRSRDRLGMF